MALRVRIPCDLDRTSAVQECMNFTLETSAMGPKTKAPKEAEVTEVSQVFRLLGATKKIKTRCYILVIEDIGGNG